MRILPDLRQERRREQNREAQRRFYERSKVAGVVRAKRRELAWKQYAMAKDYMSAAYLKYQLTGAP